MTHVAVAPIVEGHGEVEAVRVLLSRIVSSLALPCVLQVLQPIRVSRSKVVRDDRELMRAIELGALKLGSATAQRKFVLLLLDADEDLGCELGPRLLRVAQTHRADVDIACVLPVTEYESWLVSGAESLARFLQTGFEQHIPEDTETAGVGKGWIQRFFAGPKYSETADQARLTAALDIDRAMQRSRSFTKLCREIRDRCAETDDVAAALP